MSGEAQVVGAASGLPGQAVYTPATLRIYDAMVLGFSNRFLWCCPTAELVGPYDANVSPNHLDAGVATSSFLHPCRFPSETPPLCLVSVERRVRDWGVTTCSSRLAPLH